MKLDQEPRLIGVSPPFMEWARKVAQVVNSIVDAFDLFPSQFVSKTGDTMTGSLGIAASSGDSTLILRRASSAVSAGIIATNAGSSRWSITMGASGAESGAATGGDFGINRFNNAGTFIDSPVVISRASGQVSMSGTLAANTVTASSTGSFGGTVIGANGALTTTVYGTSGTTVFNNVLNTAPAGFSNILSSQHNPGVFAKWQMQVGSQNFDFKNDGHATCVAWDSTSDRRVKTNLEAITGAIDRVALLKAWTYDRTDVSDEFAATPRRHAGLIAQDVQAALPEAVSVAADERGTLSYEAAAVVALLAAAINEQQSLIQGLRAELDILKGA